MKKLMIAAFAVAMTAGVFAAPQGDPLVYNYKASVKHMYLKELEIKTSSPKFSGVVYQKYQRNATLTGYLIMDADGATSQAIVTHNVNEAGKSDYLIKVNGKATNPKRYYNSNSLPATGLDFGRNRGFLVVRNDSLNFTSQYNIKESDVKYAKVLPAVLDAKWIDPEFTKAHASTKGPAEGTLYVGGDFVAPSRYNLDVINYMEQEGGTTDPDNPDAEPSAVKFKGYYTGIFERGNKLVPDGEKYAIVGDNTAADDFFGVLPPLPVSALAAAGGEEGEDDTQEPAGGADPDNPDADADAEGDAAVSASAGMVAIADYRWTSLHLFGWFNGPNWFDNGASGPFDNFETAWDTNLPEDLKIGFAYFHPYFHDTWMNGGGFGFWTKDANKVNPKRCCGRVKKGGTTYNAPVLESLSGNLKGGLFICTENGIASDNNAEGWDNDYMFFDGWAGGRGGWEDQFVTARLADAGDTKNYKEASTGTYITAGDRWQNDMWQDGSMQQETTDVISGTWSIKLNPKFHAEGGIYDKYYKAMVKKGERGIVTSADIENLTSVALTHVAEGAELNVPYAEAAYGLEVLVGTIKVAVLDLTPKAVFINGKEISDIEYDYQDDPEVIPENVPAITPAFASYYGLGNWDATIPEQGGNDQP